LDFSQTWKKSARANSLVILLLSRRDSHKIREQLA
jgi:hypothetical protein